MTTMKAVRIHSYGDPEVLTYEDAPRPEPGEGEVLIRVQAAGVNPIDWKVRSGQMQGMLAQQLPLTLGWDVAGVLESVGAGVTNFQIGASVYSSLDMNRDGAYAEYVIGNTSGVALKPATLNFIQAAGVPVVAQTAWQALFEIAALSAGQTVLVHGAAGSVGSFAVQLARWKGARAIATASAHSRDRLQELGADQIVDYKSVRFEDVVQNVDVVLDTVGGDTQERSWGVLKPGGILVSTVSPPSSEAAAARGVRGEIVFLQPNAGQLTEIAKLIDARQLIPMDETVMPLAEARQAHEAGESGRVRGKIVLQVGD